MKEILVCVGSSCHLKGSYEVIEMIKRLIKEKKLEESVSLKAAFCLNRCTSGVTVTVDGMYLEGVTVENAKQKIKEALGEY